MMLPPDDWADNLPKLIQNFSENILFYEKEDEPAKSNYWVFSLESFTCGAYDFDELYWTMNVIFKEKEANPYWFEIRELDKVHWSVALTQAYRTKEPLAFKIDEATNEILDIRKIK